MVKAKQTKPKAKVQETKQVVQTIVEPQKPIKTLRTRIDEVVNEYYENKRELKKQIFNLAQRVLHPEQFCPKCDERMFFQAAPALYDCPNCGYQVALNQAAATVTRPATPGAVPKEVEQMISNVEQDMKTPERIKRPSTKGEKIRAAVAKRDGVGPPTAIDKRRIKQDPNVMGEANWV